MDKVGERLSAPPPEDADPQAVADDILRIVELPKGSRLARSVIDFVGDGAAEVLEVPSVCVSTSRPGSGLMTC